MNPEASRTRRTRLLALASLLVVFVAGVLVGAAAEHARRERGFRGEPPRRPGPPEIFAAQGELGRRLHLTAEQSDSIQRIILRDRAKADAIFREMRPRLRARFDSTSAAIDAVLTPEQRAEFRRLREEHRAQRRGRRGGRGGPEWPVPPPEPPEPLRRLQ